MARSNESDDRISILLCTANLGNAQPDQESWHRLVPNDGQCSEVAASPYPLQGSSSSSDESSTSFLRQEGRQFDLIVFGLQEATFDPTVGVDQETALSDMSSSVLRSSSRRTMTETSHSETSSNTRIGLKAKLRSTRLLGKAVVKQTKSRLESLTANRDYLTCNHTKQANGVQELRSLMTERLPSYEPIV
jgi:hypothetical protein